MTNLLSAMATAIFIAGSAGMAQASQGPGVAAGTASPLLQQTMAIAVYGACALVIAFGLFGALRQR